MAVFTMVFTANGFSDLNHVLNFSNASAIDRDATLRVIPEDSVMATRTVRRRPP